MDRSGPSLTGPGSYCPYSTDSSSSARSYIRPFDTIRALHETIVSLRTALEDSRRENERLQKQINVRDVVEEGRGLLKDYNSHTYGSTPRDLNTSVETQDAKEQDRKLKKLKKRRSRPSGEETVDSRENPEEIDVSQPPVQEPKEEPSKKKHPSRDVHSQQKVSVVPDIQIVSHPTSASGHPAMASRIDVKIKVSSNINVDGSSSEAESSEATTQENVVVKEPDASETPEDEDKTIAEEEEGDRVTIKEEFIKADASNLKINLTNEENLSVTRSTEGINIRQTSSENLHVDVDRQSNPSISEGDNSVFTEGATTPVDQEGATGYTAPEPRTSVKKSESENQEEVDDIELIFSSDDNKDVIQEDLVSISDFEPWQETGQAGTPVLIKFKQLSSDQESSQKGSIDRSDSEVVDGEGSSRDPLPKEKSLESQDSLNLDSAKKGIDFRANSTSLEKDSSLDYGASGGVKREDSFDVGATSGGSALGKRWTNYNVLIETDISKCGIAEENILEMGRRNTCPNPPAYRPIIHTGSRSPATASNRSPLAVKFSRSPRTYSPNQYLPPGKTLRTVTAADSTAFGGDEAKRSRAAQTDITALSQQWRSETHLPVSEYGAGLYTLPSKFVPPPSTGSRKFSLRLVPMVS
ncbi:AAEL003305-PA [Aedes aegypti]|uniref:AAEL003305-PA n=1 Tax=Aedes aegypti TaxID=7159 RepID=Q17FT5_AEDAE|nr:AAEL003305-PA [Aedes aegypti]